MDVQVQVQGQVYMGGYTSTSTGICGVEVQVQVDKSWHLEGRRLEDPGLVRAQSPYRGGFGADGIWKTLLRVGELLPNAIMVWCCTMHTSAISNNVLLSSLVVPFCSFSCSQRPRSLPAVAYLFKAGVKFWPVLARFDIFTNWRTFCRIFFWA